MSTAEKKDYSHFLRFFNSQNESNDSLLSNFNKFARFPNMKFNITNKIRKFYENDKFFI